jgi:hypothetical protein
MLCDVPNQLAEDNSAPAKSLDRSPLVRRISAKAERAARASRGDRESKVHSTVHLPTTLYPTNIAPELGCSGSVGLITLRETYLRQFGTMV